MSAGGPPKWMCDSTGLKESEGVAQTHTEDTAMGHLSTHLAIVFFPPFAIS